jgi:hypothetical protein
VSSTGVLIETIPQSSNSHSVAADASTNLIFVPQVAPASVVGPGGDSTTVGQQLAVALMVVSSFTKVAP